MNRNCQLYRFLSFYFPSISKFFYEYIIIVCNCRKEQEEQRLKLGEALVASNKLTDELETALLNRLMSTYRCITDDTDFISALSETNVSVIFSR